MPTNFQKLIFHFGHTESGEVSGNDGKRSDDGYNGRATIGSLLISLSLGHISCYSKDDWYYYYSLFISYLRENKWCRNDSANGHCLWAARVLIQHISRNTPQNNRWVYMGGGENINTTLTLDMWV